MLPYQGVITVYSKRPIGSFSKIQVQSVTWSVLGFMKDVVLSCLCQGTAIITTWLTFNNTTQNDTKALSSKFYLKFYLHSTQFRILIPTVTLIYSPWYTGAGCPLYIYTQLRCFFTPFGRLARLGPDAGLVWPGRRTYPRALFIPNRSVETETTRFFAHNFKRKSIHYSILSLQVASLSSATSCC